MLLTLQTAGNPGRQFSQIWRYQFYGDTGFRAGDVSSLLGIVGVTMTNRKTFTVLNVKQGGGSRCDDKVGATWTGREFETAAKDFFPADDVTVAINNDVTA